MAELEMGSDDRAKAPEFGRGILVAGIGARI